MRILLVEDDGFHQAMMGEALRSRWPDCEIRAAGTCADALDLVRAGGYDACILDLILPDGDAMDVLRQLRGADVLVPVIMVTGQGDELVAVHAMKEGVSDYIIKRGEYWDLLPRSLEESLEAAARGLVPSPDATGRFRAIKGVGPRASPEVDETLEPELHKELMEERSARWSLEKQLRHRSEFVGNVSHDLRTPLTAVKNALEILQSDFEPGLSREVRHFVDVARRGADRLVQILDDLLDMSRLEAGRFDLRLEPVDMNEVCEEIVGEVRPPAAAAHVELEYARAEGLGPAYVDPCRIREVLRSLLNQAIRSAPSWSGIHLRLDRAGRADGADDPALRDGLCVSVQDAAPPLSEVDLETLFDRYVPGQDQSGAQRKGAGLSLPLARELVIAHSGRIWAVATGAGNKILFTLPAYSEETVLLLELESEKKKARRQFSSVSLIMFRLLNAEQSFGAAPLTPRHPGASVLLKAVAGHIRGGTGKAVWWRGSVPVVAVLASTGREGAKALAGRLRRALCSYGAASLGLERPLTVEFGISVYPEEKLDGPELITAALEDEEGEFIVS